MSNANSFKSSFLSEKSPVSVVIPTYNRYTMLKSLLESLKFSKFPVKEIIVVDDASKDPTYNSLLEEFPYIKYIRHDYVMYVGESRNDGIRLSSGDYIFMVDDDNTVDRECIGNLVDVISKDQSIGVAAPVTCYYSKKDVVMYAGSRFSKYIRRTIFLFKDQPYDAVQNRVYETDGFANSYMFRKESVRKVYPIPKEILLGGEDGFIQFRINEDLVMRLILVGNARVFHNFLPSQMYSRMTPFKLYYAMRGKITFEKKLESGSKKLLFFLSIPIYAAYYLQWALRTKRKKDGILAVILGLGDGLLGIYKNRY